MKSIQKKLCILTVICMLVSSMAVTASASSLTSTKTVAQKVVLYYPNGDWGLTPVETSLSINVEENIYVAALRKLTDPDELVTMSFRRHSK